jgi:hypothetical protein
LATTNKGTLATNKGAEQTTTAEVDLAGTTVTVRRPTEEQLVVWQAVAIDAKDMRAGDNEAAARFVRRAMRICQTLIADEAGREWLYDAMLDGRLTLRDAMRLPELAVEAFGMDQAPAPANGPPPRARRRR